MTDRRIDAVVLNYRQADEVVGCVESLRSAGLPPDRIHVVDNASHDGSAEALERRVTELFSKVVDRAPKAG